MLKCWEFKKCGKDVTGDCPAYPSSGRICWLVAGTLCGGKVQGTFAQKMHNCMECDFYKAVNTKTA
ncbi:MAG: hypothetical protein QME63_02990 [Actinomycetota bacterium]|nr:hypothetical protein [Actinomycetota bacterium]